MLRLCAFVLPLCIVGGAQWAAAATQPSLHEILRRAESARTQDGAQEDRALSRALRHGFLHTAVVERSLDRVLDPIAQMLQPSWLEYLERRAALERLRPPRGGKGAQGFDIPMVGHPLVDAYVEYFTGDGRAFFEKWLARAARYQPIMVPILQRHGLPADTFYLALIESGLSAGAVSSAKAGGFWQFMPATAKLYGLRQDNWVDERRDFVRATECAALMLKELHARFGDWPLAWAAYNAGWGRITRALEKTGARTFWELIEHDNAIAKETRHYVPKLMAAALVAKDPAAHGFRDVTPLGALEDDELRVSDATDLSRVAERVGVSLTDLRTLNPAVLHDVTPPARPWTLRVPRGTGAQVAAWLKDAPRSRRVAYRQHTVGRGDTLHGIARRYGTTAALLRDFNKLRNPNSLHAGQRLVVPVLEGAAAKSGSTTKAKSPALRREAQRTVEVARRGGRHHVVASGETLWSIAQRYGLTVTQLKEINSLNDNNIRVGAKLQVKDAS